MEEAKRNGHPTAYNIIENFHKHYDNHGMNIALELCEAAVQELANEYHNKCYAMYGK